MEISWTLPLILANPTFACVIAKEAFLPLGFILNADKGGSANSQMHVCIRTVTQTVATTLENKPGIRSFRDPSEGVVTPVRTRGLCGKIFGNLSVCMGQSHVDLLNYDGYDDSTREIRTSTVRPLKKRAED